MDGIEEKGKTRPISAPKRLTETAPTDRRSTASQLLTTLSIYFVYYAPWSWLGIAANL